MSQFSTHLLNARKKLVCVCSDPPEKECENIGGRGIPEGGRFAMNARHRINPSTSIANHSRPRCSSWNNYSIQLRTLLLKCGALTTHFIATMKFCVLHVIPIHPHPHKAKPWLIKVI